MSEEATDFIRQRIRQDLDQGAVEGGVVTRFPPEPNGYLHIGHAKSICLNFGVAREFGGYTYLRFDDTNPAKESDEYVESIKRDVAWLGYDWGSHLTHASDYFDQLYNFAVELIERGKAFVCSLSGEEIRASRGTLTEPGTDSPYRSRSIEENLDLFARMKAGEFADGEHVLRAKIDMASANVNLRDPVIYRIRHVEHQRTGDRWVVYPMYDFTHCICDALEGITHSLCTLEFQDHRPLYDWVLDNININFHPPQIEFSRLALEHTVMSKRLLNQMVDDAVVSGWDDPRMPTIAGLRRRGVPAAAILASPSRTDW
jgi:glutaminyl-tRNA synthetase